jgi:hypothetical protein
MGVTRVVCRMNFIESDNKVKSGINRYNLIGGKDGAYE